MKPTQLAAVAAEFGTPCYVYDADLIERNVNRFAQLTYPHRSVHFASMANNNPELLRMVRGMGLGIFVNSVQHLKLAMACGFTADDIIYTSTGVRRADLKLVAELGIAIN